MSEFKERCLIQGCSLFTDLAVWNPLTCQELIDFYVENLDEGDGDFLEKLETQLANSSAEAKVLASEMLWLMFLCPSNTGPESKRKSIERVFNWSGYKITTESRQRFLSDIALTGIGSAGTAYNTGRCRELVYVVQLVTVLLKLSELERRELLNDVERLPQWLESIPENGSRQFRHMFLYLLFPESHERIFGNTDRRAILTTLSDISTAQYNRMNANEVDAELLALRQSFEVEFGTRELDYYVEPLLSKWKRPKPSSTYEINDTVLEYDVKMNGKPQPLNMILYGPPGTGKTYNTINKALEIVDPEFYHLHCDDRVAIKKRFDELLNINRIGFVTFHQSFSYEDFVEGLKAATENNQVNYKVEDGIFKKMCSHMETSRYKFSDLIVQQECFASFSVEDITDELIVFRKRNGNRLPIAREVIDEFCQAFDNGKFDLSLDQKYWLKSFENRLEPYLITGFDTLYRDMLPKLLERRRATNPPLSGVFEDYSAQKVLIIDEINRGNISNIFGELITLIEPSKRAGGEEALSVRLPYSKETFSVPDNLHIIGTMNTADKSLAQVDIALRRRFQFQEMMTDYELLSTIPTINGIDIKKMVETINKRIELLYDHEHTIGHSFFLPLVKDSSIERLSQIMELEILPLLEEYFFEDWERVAMVLGDHLKSSEGHRFIREQFDMKEMTKLMGVDWELNGAQPYVRNSEALKNPDAYIGIYS
ncbi:MULTISPECIES: McrB family protein [Vibrio]|uniref:McrB family protein n=1 Tax=Vibrio TaxID=662 RepID=UPI002076057E|nr:MULTISPECIES: AAA family ATPase [Vibrio]USD34013.1 AAA family ATPase [Vibrio sp. SCSIO 43186]USD47081.1 AAA family ATPase [Vibrio sp. SCSIO 43145]USD71137.1 AAA family ATPase [Vibrio sp. SCSIO 43139]USD95472.1 McrB [Vibrio coralliilyticus]